MTTDLLLRDELAERNGGVWSYISPSRLSLWLKCPLAFKFRYIDGIRTPTTPSLFIGRVVHAALETYYRHRQLGVTLTAVDVKARLIAAWNAAAADDGMKFSSAVQEQECQDQAARLIVAYLGKAPGDEPRPLAVELAAEAPLIDPASGENLGIPLVGVIDLVLDRSAGPVICDFKTAARSSQPLEITHEIQLGSYSYLFRHESPVPESGLEIRSLIKTKVPQIQFHPYPARTERHFRRLFAVIRAYLDDLDAGRFVFRPGLGCSMCDYRESHCRKWAG